MHSLRSKLLWDSLRDWSRDATDPYDYADLRNRLELLAERYRQYDPTRFSTDGDVYDRVADCLESIADDRQRRRFVRLLGHILFIAREEMEVLYHAVYSGPIARWLIDVVDLELASPNLGSALDAAAGATWFCPITDSMPIAHFYHTNRLTHSRLRPDFTSLAAFADPEQVSKYCERNGLRRIVLLEDFVGTGRQMRKAVEYASALPHEPAVLVAPAIACPPAMSAWKNFKLARDRLTFEPLSVLGREAFITQERDDDEQPEREEIRAVIGDLDGLLNGPDREVGPFGFESTGSLVVLHSNCPNNSIALIHQTSERWSGVFPRSRRIA